MTRISIDLRMFGFALKLWDSLRITSRDLSLDDMIVLLYYPKVLLVAVCCGCSVAALSAAISVPLISVVLVAESQHIAALRQVQSFWRCCSSAFQPYHSWNKDGEDRPCHQCSSPWSPYFGTGPPLILMVAKVGLSSPN